MPAKLQFNHAMIYSRNVAEALRFYRDLLGFELLEEYPSPHGLMYARLRVPETDATIALHLLERGQTMQPGGIRLYFEVRGLDAFCKRLVKSGAKFSKPPAMMPWGWKHAYLDDPDGHEVSLYRAGPKRLKGARLRRKTT